ncbi:unnamed protein product [Vitrella brassicaformis CCMP3155]|uniref:TLDc domain-containing protein n=1 Tax=Vitrella brassicaformis (strain CCMP3155) TaxID=1169540 RepID=A0A0G4GVY7_VITBC|nr:unnamed protein product [Vitrella brassicaformis CCMP3155]|eukprot:CEM35047.1 unnamed protein product [Vitrella brassicaformis CCMP3155]
MMLMALAVTLALCVAGSSGFVSLTKTTQVRRLQEGPPAGSSLSESEYDGLRHLLEATNDTTLTTLYRASVDGTAYGDMLDRVENKTELVIVIRNAQYVFGVYIRDGIRLPDDPTGTHEYHPYMWWFSLAGHYSNPTKMRLTPPELDVEVAGREGGSVPSGSSVYARVYVGGGFMLGRAGPDSGRPATDIRNCRSSMWWGTVSAAGDYMGVSVGSRALLGGSEVFVADEIEMLTVE